MSDDSEVKQTVPWPVGTVVEYENVRYVVIGYYNEPFLYQLRRAGDFGATGGSWRNLPQSKLQLCYWPVGTRIVTTRPAPAPRFVGTIIEVNEATSLQYLISVELDKPQAGPMVIRYDAEYVDLMTSPSPPAEAAQADTSNTPDAVILNVFRQAVSEHVAKAAPVQAYVYHVNEVASLLAQDVEQLDAMSKKLRDTIHRLVQPPKEGMITPALVQDSMAAVQLIFSTAVGNSRTPQPRVTVQMEVFVDETPEYAAKRIRALFRRSSIVVESIVIRRAGENYVF